MDYFIAFLEGIITFISPCLLPMLPIYISYFAGGSGTESKRGVKNALGFILGFTIVFVLLGALAGTLGTMLKAYSNIVNLITGGIVVFFGLHFLGVFKLRLFQGNAGFRMKNPGFFSTVLFGMVFAIGWTPCVGAFLGSALMLATSKGNVLQGVLMLFAYSLGLGIPFFISAILIERLKSAFAFIKSHYQVINIISGLLLIVIGIFMMTGLFGKLLGLMS